MSFQHKRLALRAEKFVTVMQTPSRIWICMLASFARLKITALFCIIRIIELIAVRVEFVITVFFIFMISEGRGCMCFRFLFGLPGSAGYSSCSPNSWDQSVSLSPP